MINLLPKKNDDLVFTRIVTRILNNSISITNSDEVYVVQIDHRFDYKWLGFSHKFLGAAGAWHKTELRIPPFTPEKVVEESYFLKVNGKYLSKEQKPLHIHQTSDDNRFRLLKRLTKNGLFLWYSGDTKINSQASIMCYSVLQETNNYWFASFVNNKIWQIRGTWNISKNEILNLSKSDFAVSSW